MACPHPMTAVSMAQIVATWVTQHGRLPAKKDCTSGNGLVHWTTIYRRFPGHRFSQRISAALALVSVTIDVTPVLEDMPAVVLDLGMQREAREKLRPCLGLGCDVVFLTTPDVRLCDTCRGKRRLEPETYEEPAALNRAQLRRYGVGTADWEDLMVW